jgi:hypothetical protein
MSPMRVSIALATFNGERFLGEQLDSFLRQTRMPDELCVSDDCSDDGTLNILESFQSRAPFPVRIISSGKRLGANLNFENAVSSCGGDVILFSDQDDVWLPRHVEVLADLIESDSGIVAAASNSKYVTEALAETGVDTQKSLQFPDRLRDAVRRLPANQFELVLRHRLSAGHGMAIRASILPLVTPFSERWTWDQWVFILAAACGLVTYATEPLTLHRQHARQTVRNRRKSLARWAAQSNARTESGEFGEIECWREIAERAAARRDLLGNPVPVLRALNGKLAFIAGRAHARREPLPGRFVFALRELATGRYHRFGRGMLAFARDLYGSSGIGERSAG